MSRMYELRDGTAVDGARSCDVEPEEGRAATDEFTRKRFTDANWQVLDIVRDLADANGVTPPRVSLAWLLHKPVVDAPIVGPRTIDHLEDDVGALNVELTTAEIERLEAPITPVWNNEIGDV